MKKLYVIFTETQQDANALCEHMSKKAHVAFPGCWRSDLTYDTQTIKDSVLDTIRHVIYNAPQDTIAIGLNHALYVALQANFPKGIEILPLPAEDISKITL